MKKLLTIGGVIAAFLFFGIGQSHASLNVYNPSPSGGSGATTSINGVAGPTFTFSVVSTSSASSVTTSSANLFLNLLSLTSSSQITISPTGTIVFASNNISQFANNSGYLTTSTSLGTGNFSSANISQWTNNVPYLTSSTVSIGSNPITDGGETVNGNVSSTSFTVTTVTSSPIGTNSSGNVIPMWGNNYADGNFPTTGVAFTANSLKCFGFPATIPVQFKYMVYNVQQADPASSTDKYDWSIYLTSSTNTSTMSLVADFGGIAANVTGTASSSITQTQATLLPSNSQSYFLCVTGNSTTAKYGYVGANIGDYANNTTQSASASGVAPSTSTVPAQSWSSTALPWVYLYE